MLKTFSKLLKAGRKMLYSAAAKKGGMQQWVTAARNSDKVPGRLLRRIKITKKKTKKAMPASIDSEYDRAKAGSRAKLSSCT